MITRHAAKYQRQLAVAVKNVRKLSGEREWHNFPFVPLTYNFAFTKVFSDKRNMRNLFNSVAEMNPSFDLIEQIHNIEVRDVTSSLELKRNEHTILLDVNCTYHNKTKGVSRLIKTNSSYNILSNAVDFARLHYWDEWKKNKCFSHHLQTAVIIHSKSTLFTYPSVPCNYSADIDIRGSCKYCYTYAPRAYFSLIDLHAAPLTPLSCASVAELWAFLIRDAHLLPAVVLADESTCKHALIREQDLTPDESRQLTLCQQADQNAPENLNPSCEWSMTPNIQFNVMFPGDET